jgi:hypothetical protein
MFTWWHRVRDGTLTRQTFQRRMEPKAILKLKWALFTFVRKPTNNVSYAARGVTDVMPRPGLCRVRAGVRGRASGRDAG